jgi:hypothetical protein
MPILEVVLDHLAGASVFFSLDLFKGYWQFKLDLDSQEMQFTKQKRAGVGALFRRLE